MRSSALALTLALVVFALAPACAPAQPAGFTLLQANIGNARLRCGDGYVYKLCEVAVEERIRDQIRALSPDVIALQEVLPDTACAAFVEEDPAFVCHPAHTRDDSSQIHRLLGDDYDVVCDDRHGYECVAGKKGVVELRSAYAVAPPVAVDGAACDDGFSVGAVVLSVRGVEMTVVNGHPQSGFEYGCRKAQLDQVFGELAVAPSTILSGDWNLDPFSDTDESADAWVAHVGGGARFAYHSGIAERAPPFPTTELVFPAVLDHVASDSLEGSCATLGEAPGTARLDGGAGCDHRALLCALNGKEER